MKMTWPVTRCFLAGMLCFTLGSPARSSADSQWPQYAVRIVSMHSLGSIDDPIARPLAEELKKSSRFQVALQHHLLDAKPSGPEVVAGSVPNGQTIGVLGEGNVNQGLRHLSLLARTPLVLVAHSSSGFSNFRDIVRAARQRPGQVLIGSPGPESSGHLAIEEFNTSQGIELTAIAYKSSGPLISDLVSGRMALGVVPLSAALAHIKAGRLRALGISSREPDTRLPDIKTLSSQGLENYELYSWWGAFSASTISDDIAAQIESRFSSLANKPEFVESMRSKGIDFLAQDGLSLIRAIESSTTRRSTARGARG